MQQEPPSYEKTQNPIYEILDGKNVWCNRAKQDRQSENSIQELDKQEYFLITVIGRYLNLHLDISRYLVAQNERFIEISKEDKLSSSIAVYEKIGPQSEQELPLFLKLIIEIDNCVDLSSFDPVESYFEKKTKKFLDFGVEQVIWVNVENKTMTIATPNTPLRTIKWEEGMAIIGGLYFSLQQLLDEHPLDTEKFLEE